MWAIWPWTALSAAFSARGVMLRLVSITSMVASGTRWEQPASRNNTAKVVHRTERSGFIIRLLSITDVVAARATHVAGAHRDSPRSVCSPARDSVRDSDDGGGG